MGETCKDCGDQARVRVKANGKESFVCETHRQAIVKRIEQATAVLGTRGPNATAVAIKMLEIIEFEDLP